MADAVLSVRMENNLKEKFLELAKAEQLSNKELVEVLVNHFELERLKTGQYNFSTDIEELNIVTKRMSEIFVNMVSKVQRSEVEENAKAREAIDKVQQQNNELQSEIDKLKDQLKEADKLKEDKQALTSQLQQLNDDMVILKDLNHMLKQQNENQTTVITSLQSKLESYDKLAQQMSQYEKELNETKQLLAESKRLAEQKEMQWQLSEREHQIQLQEQEIRLQKQFQEQLARKDE